jgi:pentatricopeptide repeat protein
MMANGAFAAAPAGVEMTRFVAGARRGAPAARHARAPRTSLRAPSRRSAADALAASLGGRSPASRLAAVREPAGDARRADVASTSFASDEPRRDEQGSASADAARRVRAAKSAASRYGAGDANPDDATPVGSAAFGSGGTDSGSHAEKDTSGAGAERAREAGRNAGGRRDATDASSSSSSSSPSKTRKPKKIDYRLRTRARTKYNRPRRETPNDTVDMDDLLSTETHTKNTKNTKNAKAGSNVWLSNRHAARPGQQPQQRANGARGKGGMRPGERIVAALQKVPNEFLDGVERLERLPETSRNSTRDVSFGNLESNDSGMKANVRARDEHENENGAATKAENGVKKNASTMTSYDLVDSAVTRPLGSRANFSAPTLNFAIKELGERGDFSRAHALFLWMRAQGKGKGKNAPGSRDDHRPNRHTLASLFSAASDKAHARIVIKTWRDAVRADKHEFCTSEVASSAIAALARCENWPAALQVWQDLGDAGEPRNAYCYTAILSCLKDARRWEEARDVFRAMRDEPGCEPDATCAGLTLAAFDAARKWREGNALAKRFEDVYGVKPEERLTHAAVLARGKSGRHVARARRARPRAERSLARRHDVHVQLPAGRLRAERGLGERERHVRGAQARAVRAGRVHVHAPHLGGGARRRARSGGRGVARSDRRRLTRDCAPADPRSFALRRRTAVLRSSRTR